MSRKIDDLHPDLQNKAVIVVANCKKKGVDLLIYCTYRSLQEQARLFRKSRNLDEIYRKIKKFQTRNLSYLAEVIKEVGPQKGINGQHVTFAGPGESWHNYGFAFDAVPLVDGKAAWHRKKFAKEWEIYGETVEECGLKWAGRWIMFNEFPHAQSSERGNPLKVFRAEQILNLLKSAAGE